LYNDLIEEMDFQIHQIDKQFDEFSSYFKNMDYETPDLEQTTIMAAILHSFYTGLENIFIMISKKVDGFTPSSVKSHQELLDFVHENTSNREAIINEETFLILNEYMKFRHVFRHGYSFQLKWEKMKSLAVNLFDTWDNVKEQLVEFVDPMK